jgi:hypothetical protein
VTNVSRYLPQPLQKIPRQVLKLGHRRFLPHTLFIKHPTNRRSYKFIWDIRFALNYFLLDFELEHPENVLQRFLISEELYADGINKHSLIKAIKRVFKGKLQCIWITAKTFGEEGGVGNDNSMFV